MATIEQVELLKWEKGQTQRAGAVRFFFGVWFNYLPKMFGWTLSPVRLVLG